MRTKDGGPELREQLRQATAEIHAGLDKTVGHLPMASDRDYAAFLSAQHSARSAVERALAAMPPASLSAPPSQLALLKSDLNDLGARPAGFAEYLRLATPNAALGAAWTLAGSSLGNRAMLAHRRKAGLAGAERFLSDERMPRYFAQLRQVLEQPHSATAVREAISGAQESFAIFERAFAALRLEVAA